MGTRCRSISIFTDPNQLDNHCDNDSTINRLCEKDDKDKEKDKGVVTSTNILKESSSRVVLGIQQDTAVQSDRMDKPKSRVPRHAFNDTDAVTVSGDEDENVNSVNIDRTSSVTSTPEKVESGAHQVTPDKPVFPTFTSMFFNTPA